MNARANARRARAQLLGFAGAVVLFAYAPRVDARCAQPSDPDCVDRLTTYTGTLDFFATGASFGVNNDADDRPDVLLEVAEVDVTERRIPQRATLVQAFLYWGGSLFPDDNDTISAPDDEVAIQVPGSDQFERVTGEQVYQSGGIPGFPEVFLYAVRADITEIMKRAGGQMVGTYKVRGFDADIFFNDMEHTAANASFSIVLVFEEPRLPPRTIVLFDGEQEVIGSTVTLDLSGFTVSQVPSGQLTFYAQEGDCNPGPADCAMGNNLSGLERVRVIGAEPARTLILQDEINFPNDIFNRTINTTDPPHRWDVPGVDIDQFDITPVLRAGDDHLRVELTSPLPSQTRRASGELIGLVYVVVGIDVFAPELRLDSKIDIRTERGDKLAAFYPGDPLRISYDLSNTGNLPATEVKMVTDMPENITQFVVAKEPEGATVTVEPTGGSKGHGRVTVENVRVRHGEVNALVLLAETTCPLPEGGTLTASASVSAAKEGGIPFVMTSSVPLVARDRCGPRFFLYGGGGCSAVIAGSRDRDGSSSLLAWTALASLLTVRLRRRSRRGGAAMIVAAIAIASSNVACGGGVESRPDRPPPDPIGTPCPGAEEMIIVPSIRGVPSYCIDRYEASIGQGELGAKTQPEAGDGSTTAVAASVRFTKPVAGVTWFQARAACGNAGKRLCSAEEWGIACGGENDLTYPYGDEYEPSTCNGFEATRSDVVETGAMIIGVAGASGVLEAKGCVNQYGAYDLSGNVWEWNETAYFDRTRRGLVGGSFRSNRVGLRCITEDNHAPPDEENDAFGFRCCKNLP